MKTKLKIATCIVIPILLLSCSKEQVAAPGASVTPIRPQPIDTLGGKEFIFSDLTWNYWLDDFNELYTSVVNRPDLFNKRPPNEIYVYVKSVTDTGWVAAQLFNISSLSNGYAYNVYLGSLYVFPYPLIFPGSPGIQQEGSKVVLKIKFL